MSHLDQDKPTGNGFQAQLRGASLWDLVQMECMALSHRVVKITTSEDVGYLFFSGGQIIHAETGKLAGEEAALHILSWDEGSFEICERPWPDRESIQCHWQSLVMRAAHERDERAGVNLSNLLVFPDSGAEMSMTGKSEDPLLSSPDIAEAVRMAPDGSVIANRSGSEAFTDLTAYTTQLIGLIGESFGITGFQEMNCEFKEGRCLFYTDAGGNQVGVRPQPNVSIQQVKQILGITS